MMPDKTYKTPKRIRESNKQWRKAHPEKFREYSRRWNQKNPEARMIVSAKHRAKKRGLEFSITRNDVLLPEFCPILGMPLSCGIGVSGKQGGNDNSYSLDRIDSTKGYTPDNIQVISNLANSMKSSASPEQLVKFAKWVLETYSNG